MNNAPWRFKQQKERKILDLLGLLVELFLPASIWNILWKLKVDFPVPIRRFFSMQTFEDDKISND